MITLENISRILATNPDNLALESEMQTMSWRDYESAVRRLVPWIASILPAPHATVVIEGSASIPVFVLTSALATLGIPWIALDPSKPDAVRQAQLELVSGHMRVSDHGPNDVALHLVGRGETVLLSEAPAVRGPSNVTRRPFRALGFTSGTTGIPKMVMRSAPSEARRNAYFVERFGFNRADRFLLCLPLSHASGHGWARTFLTAGATVVIGTPDAEWIASKINSEEITATLLVPPMLSRVLDTVRATHGRRRVPNKLRFLLTGGRHVSASLVGKTTQTFGPVLYSYYGTTETGVNAIAEPSDFLIDPRTSGVAIEGASIRILGADNSELPAGKFGRVAIASYMNADRYSTGPVPTVTLDGDIYILTTDIGYITLEGDLRILGRADEYVQADTCSDLIGLEEDLKLLAGVTDAAAVLNSQQRQVELFVVYDPQVPLDAALTQYLAVRLGAQRGVHLPISVHPVPRLHFNSTGKFDLAQTLIHS